MKGKISSICRVALALVLVLSLGLVMATPAAASHTSSAMVAFHAGASQLVGEASALDVEVTNVAGSLGKINEVKIDFSLTDFTNIGKGVEPTNWTGVVVDSVITYTAAAGAEIAADTSLTFYPTVTNPETTGTATNPTVKTTDPGTKATLTTGAANTEISYVADIMGADGNAISIEYVNPGVLGDLSVGVADSAITVTLAHDGADPISTAAEVAAAINAYPAASLLVDASSVGTGVLAAMALDNLELGSDPDVDYAPVVGGILTIKEFLVTAEPEVGNDSSATASNYTVSFTALTEIAATTGTITITFPSGYAISLLVAGDITMTVAGSDYTPSAKTIDAVARTVTITADGVIAVDKAVVVTVANDHVKNPPTSGKYDIAVLTSGPDEGSGEVTIIPASFNVVAGTSNTVTAGTAFAVTISALNADAGSDTGYAGSNFIDFTSTGTGTIPAFELISFTAGVGTSPQNFILTAAGEAAVTIDATDESSITGTSAAITINPAGVASFTISGEAGVVAGEAFASNITVTALDADLNTKTDYVGTVTWSSTDELAVLPAAYTFTETDAGEHVFLAIDSEFTLKTAGDQTITVADEVAGVDQESVSITVTAALATSIEVTASPSVIQADGLEDSTITVTALDDFGNTDKTYTGDKSITIASSLGTIASANPSFTLGEATTTLSSDKVGTATIRVTSDFLDVTTTVKLLPLIDISTIEATVDKTNILNNDVDVRTITATYKDISGDVVTAADGADYTVTFTITVGDPTKVTLDPADGVVVPVAGVATVTLTTTLDAAADAINVTATGTGVDDALDDAIDVTEGTFEITLYQGWNLISLPLIPVDDSVDMVLAGLIDAGTVIQVRAYNASDKTWSIWASTGPYALNPTLTEMGDGLGFWVEMGNGDILTATGCVLPAPPETPPTYSVYEGWNLIGFTSLDTTTALLYLGTLVDATREAMYGYGAVTGLYEVVQTATDLVPGQGYWIAVNADGTIYP